jgi:hypothetical protein
VQREHSAKTWPEYNNLLQPIMTASSTQHKPRYFERAIQSGDMPSIQACRQLPINTQGTNYVVGDLADRGPDLPSVLWLT